MTFEKPRILTDSEANTIRGKMLVGHATPNEQLRFWQIENNPPSWLNSGCGALEHILKRYPTKEEKAAVAGVVQWFGTNCGHSFLEETLKASGYRLVYDETLPNVKELKQIQYGSVFDKASEPVMIERHGRTITLASQEMPR